MSWIPDDVFNDFRNQKETEKESSGGIDFSVEWPAPKQGTQDKPNIYEYRHLPDPKWEFYKKFYYHMFWDSAAEKFIFFFCPKSFDFEEFCPVCSVNNKLWKGTKADQDQARQLKRKAKFIGNIYVVDDPRDEEADEDSKNEGKVKLHKFPGKVEQKLKEQIRDKKRGIGKSIFDPGEEGFNFILKVGSTAKDARGNSYPDYSMSEFARKPYALGDEKEIKEIMKSTYDLDEHLKKMRTPIEKMVDKLQEMNLFELIEEEYNRIMKKTSDKPKKEEKSEDKPKEEKSDSVTKDSNKETEKPTKEEKSSNEEEDISDEDLLKELEDL